MTDNSESLEIIDTVRRKMARAITEHGRSLRAMHEMHMGPFDQALFVDTAIGEIDRLTAERDAARAELANLRNVIIDEDIIGSYIEAMAFDVEIRHGEYGKEDADEHRRVAAALRAALGIESEASE